MIVEDCYISPYVQVRGERAKKKPSDWDAKRSYVRVTFRSPVQQGEEIVITFHSGEGARNFATKICEIMPGDKAMTFRPDEDDSAAFKVGPGREGSPCHMSFTVEEGDRRLIAWIAQGQLTGLVAGVINASLKVWKEEPDVR